ncbi:uncharacterized protein LOC126777037 isoform X2 [Nymphalis io]|uniref:uncharacterized protein LOC126777037 isoform X2 n=1 Tax=Inachis io TaxID=171585 RepID=UPI0021684533|nr:uncharacterized protein LOC126777037 isoform X2 [Nymphalis io]
MCTRSRNMSAVNASTSRARVPVALLLLCVFPARAGSDLSDESKTVNPDYSSRVARSASQRFLQVISGYDDDNNWLQSLLYPERSNKLRVTSLPLLLLPVEVPLRRESNIKLSRRRLSNDYEEDEESSWQVRRGDWRQEKRRPSYIREEQPSEDEYLEFPFKNHPQRPVPRDPSVPSVSYSSEPRAVPNIVSSVPSSQLVEKFRAQTPKAFGMPPLVQSEFDISERIILPDDEDDGELEETNKATSGVRNKRAIFTTNREKTEAITPTRPNFSKPLKLRAVLSVPRADYSESYTVWWDPVKGNSRIHFHDGSTVTFREMLPNGFVKKVEMHVDRSGERVVRCGVATTVASAADRANPALPDIKLFTFSGYERTENSLVERWQHTVSGQGDTRGEVVTTRHELLLSRDLQDFIRPIRYRVSVNSTVLGPDCDTYEHFYYDARPHNRRPKFFEADINEFCDEVEQLNASSADDVAKLEPLREFTMPERDARYDALLEKFKKNYVREFANDIEGAVRKNILMQSSRLISSGNRAGATVQLGLNFLADRLDEEMSDMTGVAQGGERENAEAFPHARSSLAAYERRLPDRFDWRALGGVSNVRFQGTTCSSCWAIAVAGAVEGALFRRTKRLVPLSEQNLVDCAGPFGGRGCKGTWPSYAYDYIQHRGLPALEEYTPYKGKVEQCKRDIAQPVTRISAHVNITKYSVPALQVAIREYGPAVVIVDSSAKSFQFYKKGVLYDDRCSKKSSKHAVLAVGWSQKKGEPYFILKNSWSEAWGEGGYVRVQARANTCGVLTYPSYPRLTDDDVFLEKETF